MIASDGCDDVVITTRVLLAVDTGGAARNAVMTTRGRGEGSLLQKRTIHIHTCINANCLFLQSACVKI